MSNIYIQEPPTNGKVLLTTSLGDIDIELWPREAPKACRNFVQLCLEGYYDGTIFHRVIKDFIGQGGDPTGTGDGGESVYGKPFRDEIHTRLRFVRRGLVAMANAGPNDNGSQFFFTLGPTQELQGKHTIFGKVTGETVYNLIKMNDIHTDDNDRPNDPPKIKKTEVLSNPFDDIIPRETIRHEKKEHKKKKSQSKAKKDFKLLSFGEEAEEDEEMTNKVVEEFRSKGKSAHDLAEDPRLSNLSGDIELPATSESTKTSEEQLAGIKQKLQQYNTSASEGKTKSSAASKSSKIDELRKERKELMKEMKNSAKKSNSADKDDSETEEKTEVPAAVAEFNKGKALYMEQKKSMPKKGASREAQTLAILAKFKNKMATVQKLSSEYGESAQDAESLTRKDDGEAGSEDETDEGWLSHKLDCGDAHGKVLDANVTDVDRYDIYDPRNPMTKRRNEDAKKEAKRRKKEQNTVI